MRSFTLIRKNMLAKKIRIFLIMVAIFTAFLLFGVLASIASVGKGEAGTPGASRLVVMSAINFTQPLPLAYAGQVAGVDGVKAATHSSWFGGFYRTQRNYLIALAVDPETYFAVYPEIALDPAARARFVAGRNAIVIGPMVAKRFGWRTGDTIPLQSNIYQSRDGRRGWDFEVAGVFSSSNDALSNSLLLHYDYLNERRTVGRDMIGQVTVLTRDPARNEEVAAAIDRRFDNSQYATETVGEDQFSTMFLKQLGDIELILGIVVSASFLSILMIVGNSMMMSVRERSRQIAILKSIGFPSRRVLRMVFAESLLTCLLGGVPGLLVANLVVVGLGKSGALTGVAMAGGIWAVGLLGILLLAALTGLIPGLTAYRLDIATGLNRR
jgi:putative ABC transport system permease protein